MQTKGLQMTKFRLKQNNYFFSETIFLKLSETF
jgi:hypothetical protein